MDFCQFFSFSNIKVTVRYIKFKKKEIGMQISSSQQIYSKQQMGFGVETLVPRDAVKILRENLPKQICEIYEGNARYGILVSPEDKINFLNRIEGKKKPKDGLIIADTANEMEDNGANPLSLGVLLKKLETETSGTESSLLRLKDGIIKSLKEKAAFLRNNRAHDENSFSHRNAADLERFISD
jgi:hypothetical protein